MGELARQRRARDLWISRSHLWAMSAGVVLITLLSFFVGMSLASSGPSSVRGAALSGGAGLRAPSESLVDLLARVDARAVAQDGVDTLTFPDTLTGVADDPTVPLPLSVSPGASVVAPGEPGARAMDLVAEAADADDAHLLATALGARGWTVRVQSDEAGAQVIIQGGDDLNAARDARRALLDELDALERSVPVSLRVRPMGP